MPSDPAAPGPASRPASGPGLLSPLERGDTLHAGVVAGAAFLLYAHTACRTIFVGDSAELAGAVATFGVPHPPGYPLYTLVSGVLSHALPTSDPAFAANLLSGLYGATAVGLLFLLARRVGAGNLAALIGAISVAAGSSFWAQCVAAEVYSFDALLLAGAWHATLSAATSGRRRTWIALGLTLGLWLGHRPVNGIYLASLVLGLWAMGGMPALRQRWRPAVLGLLLATVPFAYLPLASAAEPAIDVGDPESWDRFWTVVAARPYVRHLAGGTTDLALGRVAEYFVALPREIGLACVLSPVGAAVLWRRGGAPRRLAIALGVLALANLAFSAQYNVLDIDAYFLPSFLVLGWLAAVGAQPIIEAARRRLPAPRATAAGGLGVLLALAVVPGNLARNDLREHRYARGIAEDLLASTAPSAVLVVSGDTTIHSLWYLQAVEHRREDVLVLSPGHLHPWYQDQLQARFPDAKWPEPAPSASQSEQAARIIHALSRSRPIHLARSVNPGPLLAARPGEPSRQTAPEGLTWRVLRPGTRYPHRARATQNARFLEATLRRLGPVPSRVDPDTQSTLLQYALAAYEIGIGLGRAGLLPEARHAFEHVLALEPDRLERALVADAARAGEAAPELGLARKARAALDQLQGRHAPARP